MHTRSTLTRILVAGVALTALTACNQGFDMDFRDLTGSKVDTTQAAQNLPARPRPDARGVISYPTYQVVVAQRDDTVRTIASRLGVDANQLATYNGIDADTKLRRDELLALPSRVSEPTLASGAQVTSAPLGTPQVDVTTLASSAIDRAQPSTQTTAAPTTTTATPTATAPVIQQGSEPLRHRVQRGETVYSIARLYGVPVKNIAEWNGLGADLTVREGQFLLIPRGDARPPAATTSTAETPGTGSSTPTPPSASQPLPAETVAPAATSAAAAATTTATAPATPNLSTSKPTGNANAPLAYPVQGSIIRAYAAGKNEGIDIGAAAGTAVKAAADGTVAAITKDTNGVPIMVIRHANNLLTVYTNLDGLTVAKDASVSKGQTIGRVRDGSPSFLHFEVRQGLNSVDPMGYLP